MAHHVDATVQRMQQIAAAPRRDRPAADPDGLELSRGDEPKLPFRDPCHRPIATVVSMQKVPQRPCRDRRVHISVWGTLICTRRLRGPGETRLAWMRGPLT